MKKLTIGTAQFGMNYGISNSKGKVNTSEIEKILLFCKNNNITTIDTAQGYGDSEKQLGQFNLTNFNIITKLLAADELENSLKNLNLNNIYGVMLHREDEINHNIWNKFKSWKKNNLVKKIGISVYKISALEYIIKEYPIDIVQLPINILDQRFIPLLSKLKKRNIEIHVRSVFLQGLLLMDNYPTYFTKIIPLLKKIPNPKLAHALQFVLSLPQIDKVVIGVTSLKELKEIHTVSQTTLPYINYNDFSITEEKFINPSLWKI